MNEPLELIKRDKWVKFTFQLLVVKVECSPGVCWRRWSLLLWILSTHSFALFVGETAKVGHNVLILGGSQVWISGHCFCLVAACVCVVLCCCVCVSLLVCRWCSVLPCRLWAELCGSRLVAFSYAYPGDVVYNPLTSICVCVCVYLDSMGTNRVVSLLLLLYILQKLREEGAHSIKTHLFPVSSLVLHSSPCLHLSLPVFLISIPPRSSLVNGNTCLANTLQNEPFTLACTRLTWHAVSSLAFSDNSVFSLSHPEYCYSHIWFCVRTVWRALVPRSSPAPPPPLFPNNSQGFLA